MKYKIDPQVYGQIGGDDAGTDTRKESAPRRQAAPHSDSSRPSGTPVSSGDGERTSAARPLRESTVPAGRGAPRSGRRAPSQAAPRRKPPARPKPAPTPMALVREAAETASPALCRAQVFVVAAFLGTLFLFGVLSLALPKPTVSEYERRELAAMPEFSAHELFWGSYLREVEEHYADTFPFRDGFVQAAARVNELRGIRLGGVRLIEAAPRPVTPETQPEPAPGPAAAPAQPGNDDALPDEPPADTPFQMADDGGVGEQTENGLFLYGGRAMDIFGGSNAMGSWYAETLNRFAARFGPNVRTFNIVVPTSIEFYLPDRYRSMTNPQLPQIEHIYGELKGVIPVDAYTAIQNHAGEYLYFNTDHHWTARGAYYAYTAFCEVAGLDPLPLDDYDARRIEGEFLGTFYSQSYDSMLKSAADYVEYFVLPGEFEVVRYDKGEPFAPKAHSVWAEFASGGNAYAVFLHGDYPLIHIKTGNANGRRAVLVKESFGNAFAPFLLAHYEEVYVVDLRYFERGLVSLVAEQGVDDVIFLNNAFAANTRYRIEDLEGLLY